MTNRDGAVVPERRSNDSNLLFKGLLVVGKAGSNIVGMNAGVVRNDDEVVRCLVKLREDVMMVDEKIELVIGGNLDETSRIFCSRTLEGAMIEAPCSLVRWETKLVVLL